MYVINKELRFKVQGKDVLDIIPFWCESCGRTIFPEEGKIPVKCPHCGKLAWEE